MHESKTVRRWQRQYILSESLFLIYRTFHISISFIPLSCKQLWRILDGTAEHELRETCLCWSNYVSFWNIWCGEIIDMVFRLTFHLTYKSTWIKRDDERLNSCLSARNIFKYSIDIDVWDIRGMHVRSNYMQDVRDGTT